MALPWFFKGYKEEGWILYHFFLLVGDPSVLALTSFVTLNSTSFPLRPTPYTTVLSSSRASISTRPLGGS